MKLTLVVALLITSSAVLGAQGMPGAAAKIAAHKAADAANAQLSAQTGQAVPAPGGMSPAAASVGSVSLAGSPAGPGQRSNAKLALPTDARTPKDSVAPIVMREVFDYQSGGRRDPFVSLLTTSELRPGINDLKLMGILYDMSGRRPVAIMRDVSTNAQYRVTTGQTLGRMRVAQIRQKVIVFTIEEFGLNRQDSLMLGDTTKVRTK